VKRVFENRGRGKGFTQVQKTKPGKRRPRRKKGPWKPHPLKSPPIKQTQEGERVSSTLNQERYEEGKTRSEDIKSQARTQGEFAKAMEASGRKRRDGKMGHTGAGESGGGRSYCQKKGAKEAQLLTLVGSTRCGFVKWMTREEGVNGAVRAFPGTKGLKAQEGRRNTSLDERKNYLKKKWPPFETPKKKIHPHPE